MIQAIKKQIHKIQSKKSGYRPCPTEQRKKAKRSDTRIFVSLFVSLNRPKNNFSENLKKGVDILTQVCYFNITEGREPRGAKGAGRTPPKGGEAMTVMEVLTFTAVVLAAVSLGFTVGRGKK